MLIDSAAPASNLRIAPSDTPEQILQKILYESGRSNIRDVWVANRHVLGQGTTPAS
jgi:hypothetical protein